MSGDLFDGPGAPATSGALLQIDTADRDEAAEFLGRTFPGLRIEEDPEGRPFRFHHSRIVRGMLTRTVLVVQGTIRASGFYPGHLAIGRRRAGRVSIRYGDRGIDTSRPYVRAPGPSVARFDNAEVELVIVDRAAFEVRALRYLEGTGRELLAPSVERCSPTSVAGDSLWDATADTLARSFDADAALIPRTLDDLAVAAILTSFPMTAARSHPGGLAVHPRVVARATDFMHAHLGEPITVVDIADAAHVSVRALQAAFHRHVGTTPHEHLRHLRLHATHRVLGQSEPEQTSVGETARRFGFVHLSRFAAAYRREFGENPATTLRR